MDQAASSSIRRDLASAYLATASRLGSWVIVSALVYRFAGADAFAMVALVRGTIGILNYTSVGLAPGLIRLLAQARGQATAPPLRSLPPLQHASAKSPGGDAVQRIYANGLALATIGAGLGLAIVLLYTGWFATLFHVPTALALRQVMLFAFLIGAGTVLRLASDAAGAVLQVHGRIALDNLLLIAAEWLWVILTIAWAVVLHQGWMVAAGWGFLAASGVLLVVRFHWAGALARMPLQPMQWWRQVNGAALTALLSFGVLVTAAQLADYLYAPTDYVLINRLLSATDVAVYAPAVQIDGGLLVLVSGLASVLLPRTAIAHSAGDQRTVRRYYLRGTLASLALLVCSALVIWAVSLWLFTLWLGNPMNQTRAILPLVLIHTVLGGSSMIGRSVLLGMGKVKAFTIAVLAAGVSNVILSFVFVRYLHLGLPGIVLGTIVAVVGRCVLWMPWYVLRTLRRQANTQELNIPAVPEGPLA